LRIARRPRPRATSPSTARSPSRPLTATTLAIAAGSQTVVSTFNIPLVCLNRTADGGTQDSGITDCAGLQTRFFKDPAKPGTCTDKGSGICACTQTETKQQVAETQTYTTNGAGIMTITKADGSMSMNEYCVNNNLLTVKAAGKDGGEGVIYVLNKKP
jgi:hypothetical protein